MGSLADDSLSFLKGGSLAEWLTGLTGFTIKGGDNGLSISRYRFHCQHYQNFSFSTCFPSLVLNTFFLKKKKTNRAFLLPSGYLLFHQGYILITKHVWDSVNKEGIEGRTQTVITKRPVASVNSSSQVHQPRARVLRASAGPEKVKAILHVSHSVKHLCLGSTVIITKTTAICFPELKELICLDSYPPTSTVKSEPAWLQHWLWTTNHVA